MKTLIKKQNVFAILIIVSIIPLIFPNESLAQGGSTFSVTPQKFIINVAESRIIDLNEKVGPLGKIELIDPKIADIIVLSPRQLYLTGKSPGKTTLVLRGKDVYAFTLFYWEVSDPISRIKDPQEIPPRIQSEDIRQFKEPHPCPLIRGWF